MLTTWPVRPYSPISRGSDAHVADDEGIAADIACYSGTPWIAVHDGDVTAAITDPAASDCGIQLDLEWDDGPHHWRARYCHGQAQECGLGQQVSAGDRIGSVGSTGRSDGPHLHIVLWRDSERLRPEEWLQVPVAPAPVEEPMDATTQQAIVDGLTLIWDRLDRIQAVARGETTESLESLAEECKQLGVVPIKVAIGLQ